jgi:hypothetical protein
MAALLEAEHLLPQSRFMALALLVARRDPGTLRGYTGRPKLVSLPPSPVQSGGLIWVCLHWRLEPPLASPPTQIRHMSGMVEGSSNLHSGLSTGAMGSGLDLVALSPLSLVVGAGPNLLLVATLYYCVVDRHCWQG